MALDMSVVKSLDAKVELDKFYAIRTAVEVCFDWYLGDDKSARIAKYEDLKSKVFALTKKEIVDAVEKSPRFPKEFAIYLENISCSSWKACMECLEQSIGNHHDENTHLNFDWEKAPEKSLLDCCSWNFRNIMLDCVKPNKGFRPNGDLIEELDPKLVKKARSRFMFKVPKIILAKWLGYFMPEVKERMLQDITYELGMGGGYCVDAEDLLTWNRWLKTICQEMDNGRPDDRYWLVSSY